MWQQWITGLIVALAAAYMLWRWLPAGLRKKLGRVHPAMAQSAGCGSGGGGGCSSCGGCSSSAAPRATVHAAERQERF
ncbi:hypothetical protein [uncultured Acidovorax sp.]|uniref:hypothetical protein n=1 Tax=uncultured Acidovorax sp. TaxID=158751 RepID=UPI002589DCD3|nr:hypothetical protein [uncultured Acidovorax sp.]